MKTKVNKSHLTAIARIKQSRPARWLFTNGYFNKGTDSLDYGSGRGYDAEEYTMETYDP